MKEIVCFTLFYPENFQTTGHLCLNERAASNVLLT